MENTQGLILHHFKPHFFVEKYVSPDLSGDLWGVIWYLRADFQNELYKKQNEFKKDAELPPEYFPCGGSV